MILTSLDDVRAGMALGVGLRNKEGHTLLGPGTVLTDEYIGRLHELGYCAVWIDDEDTRDIPYQDTLSEGTRLATTAAIRDTFAMTARETEKLRAVSVDEVKETLGTRKFQQAFQDSDVIGRVTGQVDVLVGEVLDRAVLTGLSSIRTHTSYTYHHCLDVAVTATMIGRLLGYDRTTLKKLAVGCLLHDIGIIFVDTEIMHKKGPLTPEEWRRVKEHTVLGYLFLRDTLRLGVLPPHVAYQHHERQDGHGYPRGLTGTNRLVQGAEVHMPGRITPIGEIAAIADFHDACSADRPHRSRIPPDQVWHLIREAAGTQLNREIVEMFLEVLPPFPLATPIVVTAGRYKDHTGVVVRVTPDAMDAPTVRILANAQGARIPAFDLDLRKEDVKVKGIVTMTAKTAGAALPV